MIEYLKEELLSKVQKEVDTLGVGGLKQRISDGYHTFAELYEFRKVYNAALFNELAKDWDLFKIPEAKNAKHPFDGHTSADVIKRLSAL